MFESLSQKVEGALKRVSGQGRISELNVADMMRDIRRALLEADVNYQVALDFTERVRNEALGEAVLSSVAPGQQLVKLVYDELVRLLGDDHKAIALAQHPPTVVLVAGLQGSGKTTFCAKLAHYFRQQGNTPLLAAADVYRPAAVAQLETLARSIDVPVYSIMQDGQPVRDAVRVARETIREARRSARDIVIVDTAGRLHVDEEMMTEVADIKHAVDPDEILFVVDSMTGQDAVQAALAFNERLDFDGVVLSKLDGDTRGGAALSIRSVVKKPIKFASIGEKVEALTPFHPDRIARRILGMGDVVSLVEKAQEQFDNRQAEQLRKKIRSQDFDLADFYEQLQQIRKMGSLSDIAGMLPGMSRQMRDVNIDDNAFTHIEAIILSMTPEERHHPSILNGSRRRRIARGSGTEVRDVNQLLKQFKDMKRMMKTVSRMTDAKRSVDLARLTGQA